MGDGTMTLVMASRRGPAEYKCPAQYYDPPVRYCDIEGRNRDIRPHYAGAGPTPDPLRVRHAPSRAFHDAQVIQCEPERRMTASPATTEDRAFTRRQYLPIDTCRPWYHRGKLDAALNTTGQTSSIHTNTGETDVIPNRDADAATRHMIFSSEVLHFPPMECSENGTG